MSCKHIQKALAILPGCVETESGSRFTTHCLYPSFETVSVYVVRFGDGFNVHDDGGAVRSIWDHAGEISIAKQAMAHQAALYGLKVIENKIVAGVPSIDWLFAGIVSVANASAAAAYEAIGSDHTPSVRENDLKEQIYSVLKETVSEIKIAKDYTLAGNSGKKHRFDFAVQRPSDGWLLMDAISPHHVSIAAKFLAFSDIQSIDGGIGGRLAVYDKSRPLHTEDEALIQTVADLVPVSALQKDMQRELAR